MSFTSYYTASIEFFVWTFADISMQLEGDGFYLYLRCFLLMGPPELGGVPPRLDKLKGDPGEESNPSEVDVFPSIASL